MHPMRKHRASRHQSEPVIGIEVVRRLGKPRRNRRDLGLVLRQMGMQQHPRMRRQQFSRCRELFIAGIQLSGELGQAFHSRGGLFTWGSGEG